MYILPHELAVSRSKQAIPSVVISVKHNGMQIIVRTGIGGASLISRMLDSMRESEEVLGTLAGDDTMFIASEYIEQRTNNIKHILDM